METDLRKTLLINTITNYVFLFWRLITSIFITRIILFGLGDVTYGFWALLWTIFGYALLLDFGFGKSIQKYTAEVAITKDYDSYSKLISSIIFAYIAMASIIAIFSIICAYYLDSIFDVSMINNLIYIRKVFLIFGCGVAFVFPTGFIPEILVGLKRTDIKNYVSISAYTIKVIGIFILFKLNYSIMALAILTVVMDLIPNIFMFIFIKKLLPSFKIKLSQFRIKHIKEVGSFSLYAYIYAIAVMILFRTDTVVLGVMVGVTGVAVYQIGTRVSMLLENLTTQFQSNLPAVAASLYKSNETEKLRWIFLRSSRLSVFISTGIFVAFLMLAKQILFVWLKITDINAIHIAYIMLCSVFISVLFRSVSIKFMQMAGEHKKVAYIMIVECIINLILSIVLVKLIGTVGVAYGTLIPNIFFSIFIIFPMFTKFTGFSIYYYLKKVYLPIIVTVLPTVLFLIFINSKFDPYSWNIIYLILWGAIAGFLYLIMGYITYFNKEEKSKYLGSIPYLRKFIR